MQNCLGELNLIYCLIYLHDIVVFSHTNLESKILNWSHQSVTFSKRRAFLGLGGHYRRFIKGFACIAQPLNNHLTGEGASKKFEYCFQRMPWRLSKHWSRCAWPLWCWPLLIIPTPFLLETDVSKDGLRAVLSQKQVDGWYHPVAYGSRALMPHEKIYHLTKLEFLALKWAVTEHFKEYLPIQPFPVKTDNNPLTYIMMTPNLDANGHWWVRVLAWFNFKLEYHKGYDNTVADVLSQVTTQLDPDMVRSVLNGVALGAAHQTKFHDPTIVEGDCHLEQEVCVATGCTLV